MALQYNTTHRNASMTDPWAFARANASCTGWAGACLLGPQVLGNVQGMRTPMVMQFTWQGCDSLLAAPLVLDLVRFTELAQRHGEKGLLTFLASFFKSPLGTKEHNFVKQFQMLEAWADAQIHPLRPKHAWVANTRVLRLHLHMTGAETLEGQLFRAYLDTVHAEHPRQPERSDHPEQDREHDAEEREAQRRARVTERIEGGREQASDGTREHADR